MTKTVAMCCAKTNIGTTAEHRASEHLHIAPIALVVITIPPALCLGIEREERQRNDEKNYVLLQF